MMRPTSRALVEFALSALALLVILCFLAPTSADADLWGHLIRATSFTLAESTPRPYSFTRAISPGSTMSGSPKWLCG